MVPKNVLGFCIIFLVIAGFAGSAAGKNNVSINIVPVNSEAKPGEEFMIQIDVNPNGNYIYGAQFDLLFDPSLLEAKTVEKGLFLGQDGTNTVILTKTIDTGRIEYGENRSGANTGVANPGTLAIVTFRVKDDAKSGGSQLFNIQNLKLSDNASNNLPVEVNRGEFNVKEAGSPAQAGILQNTSEERKVISRELFEEMNRSDDTEKISVKISVSGRDPAQNIQNLADFLDTRETDVTDVKKRPDALTASVSKRVIREISSVSFVTQITTYKDTPAGVKSQPGFDIIITTVTMLLVYGKLKNKKS